MNKKIYTLFFLTILFSLTLISSAPPFIQQSDITTGLVIETGFPTNHQLGDDYYVHAHVYNASNGLLLNDDYTGLTCQYHFYNHQINGGEHIDIGVMTQYGAGYNATVNGSLINQSGEYSTLVWCNATTEGGFFKYTFEVTKTGTELTSAETNLNLALLFLMLFLFVISLFTMYQLPAKKEIKDTGEIINRGWITYVKPIMFILSWSLLMAIIFLASGIALQYLYFDLFGKLLFAIFKIMMGLTLPMIIIWLIWIFVSIFQDKETKRMIERGGDDFGQI